MRIIITGGTGLIGSELNRSLAADGYEVIVLTRDPARYQGEMPSGSRLEAWDARTSQGWGHLADGAHAIVNLAGKNLSTIWSAANRRKIIDSRLQAGEAVTQAVRQAVVKPRVVVQPSGVGYYGPRKDELVTEDSEPGSDFLAQLCQVWEASTQGVEQEGVRRVILRIGVPLDPKGGALPKFLLPFRLFVGGPMGSGKQYLPWLHMQDLVGAIRFLMDDESAAGPYIVCAPNPVTNRQFSKALGRVLKRPSFIPVPAFALRLVLGEMSTVALTGQRTIPACLQAAGYKFQFPQIDEALHDILK